MSKFLLTISTLFILLGCEKANEIESQTPKQTLPPTVTNVVATLNPNGKHVTVSWDLSTVPENGILSYYIYAPDKIKIEPIKEKNGQLSYTITDLPLNYELNGKLEICDSKDRCSTSTFSVKTSSEIKIADVEFEKYLIYRKYDSEGLLDGKIQEIDRNKITEMLIYSNDKAEFDITKIKDLSGIELFTNLESLGLLNSEVEFLDFSNNPKIKTIILKGKFKTLNLKKNVNLEILGVDSPTLDNLDVRENINLKTLSFNTNFSSIDLSKNSKIEVLEVSPKIEFVDLSKLLNLTTFGSGGYTKIEGKNVSLGTYSYSENKLTSIDLSQNKKLKSFYMRHALISEYNFNNNLELENINVFNFVINSLSAGVITKSYKVKIPYISLEKNQKIKNLTLNGLGLEEITLPKKISILDLTENDLSTLNISHLENLEKIYVRKNKLTELVFPPNSNNWVSIQADFNNLSKIDITKIKYLSSLAITYNSLSELDLRNIYNVDKSQIVISSNPLKKICVPDVVKARNSILSKIWLVDNINVVQNCN
ncbi:hypothetical protein EGI26_10875 [Lacihabitans sp. CCS-44]|uniref:hypothetical protein n=1 Tax=Lacihabitans sp. CCS-44 TaxID=2487331 RepID=UPI0020CCD9C2|nr:hypothetical protein [Lacihabitans sp. CCS-44]MCP9755658.1 hypothetical protein [Lacihabitans sp. CCS-44]